jgi:glycosyltransferase involved in cell wall biosynthesis
MVRFALESIRRQNYSNWELCFVDDTETGSGEQSVKDILGEDARVSYHCTQDSPEKKASQGGSKVGYFWNQAIYNSDADLSFVLCDDDYLDETYLSDLDEWYSENPEVMYAHSDFVQYNPFGVKTIDEVDLNTIYEPYTNRDGHVLKQRVCEVNYDTKAAGVLDASQVSWRNSAFKAHGVKFDDLRGDQSRNFDLVLFTQLDTLFGQSRYTEIIGQYKGDHSDQFGHRVDKGNLNKPLDLEFKPY